jgi:hypothetical protein
VNAPPDGAGGDADADHVNAAGVRSNQALSDEWAAIED